MKVNGQPHASAAVLPGKEPQLPIEEEPRERDRVGLHDFEMYHEI